MNTFPKSTNASGFASQTVYLLRSNHAYRCGTMFGEEAVPTKQVPGCTSVCMIGASPRPCKTELCCGCGCTCCCDCGCFWGQPPSAASPGSGKLLSHSSSNNMCPRYLVQTMVTMKRVVNVPSTYRGLLTWLGPYKNRRSVATVPVDSVVDMQHTQKKSKDDG